MTGQRPQGGRCMGGADPEDARPGPVADVVDAQVKRRAMYVSRRNFQAITHRRCDRTGKGQCYMQIGSRNPFNAFPEQVDGGLLQGETHRIIRPQGEKQPLPRFSLPRGHPVNPAARTLPTVASLPHDLLRNILYPHDVYCFYIPMRNRPCQPVCRGPHHRDRQCR